MENERKYRNMPHHPMLHDFYVETKLGNYSGLVAPKTGKVLFYEREGEPAVVVKDKRLAAIIDGYNDWVSTLESRCEDQSYRD
jgi:hypothetical protein